MSRRPPFDIVCFKCQTRLAREEPDASWSVRIRTKTGDEWHTTTEWSETFVCPNCKAEGFVNVFDLVYVPRDRRRVRVPTRPLV